LKPIINLKRLSFLSIRGCQVPAADVAELKASAPSLRIER